MKFAPSAIAAVLIGAGLIAPACAQAQQVVGAGSSFAAPLYDKWSEQAKPSTGVSLNYQAIGSGAGQTQIFNRTVDFGASDAPVSADKLRDHKLLQFPSAMGAVDVIVNIPGIKSNELKLTGPIIAAIYAGTINQWNDPKIKEINKGIKLPRLAIAPVYRADGSGTTFVFTDYLSLVDSDWASKIGRATSISWPAGSGAKGSAGVAGTVQQIPGSIGYVEAAYATQSHLVTVQLQNKAGKFVAPTPANFAATAAAADWTKAQNFAIDLNDQAGDNSWPIESATFVLVPTNPTSTAKAAAVLKLFDWGFKNGDALASDLQYIPLPASVKDTIRAAWHDGIKGSDGKPVF
ncbi:phosphate ABC transporter substrate-binding protein PstS [Granulibacter bethesdensis]|uniref:phosphate ABC transporter substrate-binding protein PstS n=1 Tax=Granulibacter bethesdensis TaxID=364410 RepID=UPI0003F1F172|nr:phosphate ABC transporter substrate-binding protein PstS [Granulibacter bethesdensis]AHJ69310.1 Phosphate-binding protein [Granulibacter bethesdensis]